MAVALKSNKKYEPMAPLLEAIQAEETAPEERRWTVCEYYAMLDAGILNEGDRVELLDGRVVTMSPHKSPHITSIQRIADRLRRIFGQGSYIRQQGPLHLSNRSEPEPDLTVVTGSLDDYLDKHPTTADVLLAIEVSDTSLRMDRAVKGRIYAKAGIVDYWIVNLKDRAVEVYRYPSPESGGIYKTVKTFTEADSVAPLAKPDSPIPVAELLPPMKKAKAS